MRKYKIVIAGASGTIGRALQNHFIENGNEVHSIKRKHFKQPTKTITNIVTGSDVVINLCGETVLQRWNTNVKKRLIESRTLTTRKIVEAIEQIEEKEQRPTTYITASAIGVYANDKTHTEKTNTLAKGFIRELVNNWESESQRIEQLDVRRVIFRIGVVLSPEGGYYTKIKPIFSLGLGGVVGSGNQTLSFIHISDLCRAFDHVIINKNSTGIYNLTSPSPICNENFTKELGIALNRPTICTVPSLVVQIMYGEAASIILKGATVLPEKLLEEGFQFEFSNYKKAIRNLVNN